MFEEVKHVEEVKGARYAYQQAARHVEDMNSDLPSGWAATKLAREYLAEPLAQRDRKTRAAALDEAIAVTTALQNGFRALKKDAQARLLAEMKLPRPETAGLSNERDQAEAIIGVLSDVIRNIAAKKDASTTNLYPLGMFCPHGNPREPNTGVPCCIQCDKAHAP